MSGSKDIGLQGFSLLKTGTTLAILHLFGYMPVMNDLYVRVDKIWKLFHFLSKCLWVCYSVLSFYRSLKSVGL